MDNKKQMKNSMDGKKALYALRADSERLGRFRSGVKKETHLAIIEGMKGILFALLAFIFGATPLAFSTFPMGLALLSAADSKILYIIMGLSASALVNEGNALVWLLAIFFIVATRVLSRMVIDRPALDAAEVEENGEMRVLSRSFFSESIFLRMATACISAFLISLYAIIAGGFRYYDLFGAIFSMTVAPAFTFVYSGVFAKKANEFSTKTQKYLFEIGILGILASAVFAFSEVRFTSISVSVFAAMFSTLYISRTRGFLRGLIAGAVLGLCAEPIFAPVFILAALSVTGLRAVSVFFSGIAATVLGMAWGIYIDGISALNSLFPALLCSTVIFCTLDKLISSAKKERESEGESAEKAVAERRAAAGEERLSAISDAFSSLSEVMFSLSSRLKKPEVDELRRMCDSAFDSFCPECEHRELCWGSEYSRSAEMIGKLTEGVYSNGVADKKAIPTQMRRRCKSLPSIIEEINRGAAELWGEAHKTEKTEVFAIDYEALSQILNDSLEENREDHERDSLLCERVCDCLSAKKIKSADVLAFGGRKKQIIITGLSSSMSEEEIGELRAEIERTCALSLDEGEPSLEGDALTLTFSLAKAASVSYAYSAYSADGRQENCGDTVSLFENRNGYFYSLLCDGMGVGREAAMSSSLCSMFMQKMLSAGGKPETSMRMLNSFMRSKGKGSRECSATIDLMELDMLSGRVSFTKSGAASSYVKRGGDIYRIQSKTMPIGIVKALDAEKNSFASEDGDIVVMVSDGISQCENDLEWLFTLLRDEWEDDLERMSKKIIDRAGGEDDRSVIIIKIEKDV